MKILSSTLIIFFLVLFIGCERFVLPENKERISKFSTNESHKFGQNCMDCHYTAGRGEGWFTAAGSVVGDAGGSVIELIDEVTGVIKTIEVDLKHNFYTTDAIDFSNGMKVGIRNKQGEVEYMDDPIMTGQCSLCHGTSIESPIEAE